MPTPQIIRVDPLDLQKNIAIGVNLPFNGPAVFNSTFSTKEQIKANLVNLLLTNKGERIMNPDFGADLRVMLFENMVNSNIDVIKDKITAAINIYVPQVTISKITVDYDEDNSTVNVSVNYILNISNNPDQVNIQFQ